MFKNIQKEEEERTNDDDDEISVMAPTLHINTSLITVSLVHNTV